MAKSDLGKYMTPSARSFLRAQQPRVNVPQRRASFDPTLFKGKTAAAGAPLESRQIEAPIQETGPEAMSITDGEASTKPQMITETQQPIEDRGSSARYMIQGGGPRIDLSFLVPERANKAFDPSKAIGGENVPYQESKGVGGFFRRLLGDESNRMNIEAQQAQGAEWREARKEAEKEERLLNRMREADKPQALRFERQLAAEKERRDEERQIRAAEREQDRIDRLARETAEQKRWQQERLDRTTQQMLEGDQRAEELGLKKSVFEMPQVHATPGGGLFIMQPRSGAVSLVSPGTPGFGNIPAVPPSTRQVYPPPQFKPSGAGGGQVDRTTGATLGGGPLPPDAGAAVMPPRNAIIPMDESIRPTRRMVPTAEEESIDPYQLQKTTPSMGTMMEPAGAAARRRARYLSPNMPGWSLGQ